MGRTTIVFKCVAKASEYEDLKYQIHEKVQNKKKEICKEENASINDFYWSQYITFYSDNHATVALSGRTRSELDNMTSKDIEEELEELQEELEEAEEEYEDIEDLDENEYDDYDFDSEDEYKERLRGLDIDMFVLKSDIELLEKILNEKSEDIERVELWGLERRE